jgi:transcriptional regulator with XRE-family HTH domain
MAGCKSRMSGRNIASLRTQHAHRVCVPTLSRSVRPRLWCVSARSIFADLLHAYRGATTQQEAAQKLRVSKSLYQKIESGDRRPQRDFAERCDELYKTPGVFLRIYEDTVSEPYSAWFGPRVVYEDRAAVITDWEQRGIPGLLQTEDYARAVVRACRPWDSPDALEQTIKARLERQDILSRDNPPKLWVVIAEGVLRQAVGGPHVMRDQLDHLIKMSESPQAVIQVLPFSASDAPGADGPAALFEFSDGPSVAYLEGWEAGRVVEDPKEVAAISTALSMIKSCALSPTDTRQLLGEIRG